MSQIPNIYTINNTTNFGDAVNKRFWECIIQNKLNSYSGRRGRLAERPATLHYITTGSIMTLVNNKSIIFGTGFISDNGDIGGSGKNWKSKSNKKYTIPRKIIAVRGPLTRAKLIKFNIKCPANYGDPLILMPCIYDKLTNIEDNIIGIIPHYIDRKNNNYIELKSNLEAAGYKVNFINICVGDNYEKLIDNINKCKYIISSSLHGVIMGIIYKKKTIHVKFSKKVFGDYFKFQDFFQSINIKYNTINTYNVDILKNIINVDYEYLQHTGKKLIQLIPFIDNKRKIELTDKYNSFYSC
jgi:pyruvyltransferase